MINWIQTNLQLVLAVGVAVAGGTIALFGRDRLEDENGESYRRVNKRHMRRTAAFSAAAVLGVFAFPFVPAGYEGVVFDRRSGVVSEARGEGVSLIIPFVQNVTNMNVRTQVFSMDSFVQTKDLQEVTLPVSVNYQIEDSPSVYQEIGLDYIRQVFQPAVAQAVTLTAGQIEAEDIAVSRQKLTESILEALTADLEPQGFTITDVAVRDAVFDKDFIASVKAKVIAGQKEEESATMVEVAVNEAAQEAARAEGAAQAQALKGRGEAESIAAITASLEGQSYLEWLNLNKWDGRVPSVVMGDAADPIIHLPEITEPAE